MLAKQGRAARRLDRQVRTARRFDRQVRTTPEPLAPRLSKQARATRRLDRQARAVRTARRLDRQVRTARRIGKQAQCAQISKSPELYNLTCGRIHISGLRCRGAFILGCWRPVAAFAGGSLAACCLCWPLLYIRQNTTFMREGSSKLGHG